MKKIRFFGPINSHSGYGNAVKNFAEAFSDSNFEVTFAFGRHQIDNNLNFFKSLNHNSSNDNFDIDFYLHGPPWNRHRSTAKKKIAYFYWEADRLPTLWCKNLNQVDEIWAPCELVKNACLKAKFSGKIKIVPTPIKIKTNNSKALIPSNFSNNYIISEDTYKFYSIFQWHERKGYKELLQAYWKAFTEKDKVILILKVNALGFGGNTKELIRPEILDMKRKLNLKYYPPIYFIDDIISEDLISAMHRTFDCYVSPHHGEGWGMPIHDAMAFGKQIITTKFGGVTESLSDNSAHIINHTPGPVINMQWSPLYSSNQQWAYPSINHLEKIFKDVYHNHRQYEYKGENAKKIAESMSISEISKIINRELE